MTDNEFIEKVKECKTMLYASKVIGMSYGNFIKKAKKLGCYNPNQGGKGTNKISYTKFPLQDIFDGKHPQYTSYKLKVRMIEDRLLEDKCGICGWDKKPVGARYTPCELHHKDGNRMNHSKENLELICPNCHSLTANYRFRKGKKLPPKGL